METILLFVVSLGEMRRQLLFVLKEDIRQEVNRQMFNVIQFIYVHVIMITGSVGRRLGEIPFMGLESISIDYTCTGSESNLVDCLNSTLATCMPPVFVAVGCQGTVKLMCVGMMGPLIEV